MAPADAFLRGHPAQLLVTLCCRDAGAVLDEARLATLADPEAWDAFLARTARHRVMGLVLTALARGDRLRAVGDPARASCAHHLKNLRRRMASIELERDHLIAVLRKADRRALVLKGGALAGSIYPEAVERDLMDLDFLVPEESLEPVVRAFTDHGYRVPSMPDAIEQYRRHHFHMPMAKPGTLRAELHWALDRESSLTRIDPARMLEHAIEITNGDTVMRCPCPEHMMLHLVQQNCHEGFSRLSRTVDLDRIVTATPDLDWELLARHAREAGLAEPTGLSLELAHTLLGTDLPREPRGAFRPSATARLHVALICPIQSMFSESREWRPTDRLLRLWLLPRARLRLRYLVSLLAPGPSFPVSADSPGPAANVLKALKLGLYQLLVYARAAVSSLSPRGRDQMRFWSRNASSSDRR